MKYLQSLIVSIVLLVMGSGFVKINQNRENVIAKKNAPDVTAFTIKEVKDIKNSPEGIAHVIYGSFKLKSHLKGAQPIIRVPFSIPFDKNWKVHKNAKNMVFHCPYVCEYKFFKSQSPRHRWVSEQAGYSFYSLHLEHRYYYATNDAKGFTEFVLSIQQLLNKWYNIPSENLLLTGESAGPRMARLLIQHAPKKFDAFACLGTILYDIETPKKTLDGAHIAALSIETVNPYPHYPQTGQESTIQVLRAFTPPKWSLKDSRYFHHAPGKDAWDLMHLFIKGVAELREQNNGVVPTYKKWPFKKATYIATGKGFVPKTLFFPSKEFKDKWNSMPILEISKLLYLPALLLNGYAIEPKTSKPKQIIFFLNDPRVEYGQHLTSVDNLYYFSLKNAVAATIFVNTSDLEATTIRVKKYLKQLMNNKKWGNIPITLLGVGLGGEIAANAAFTLKNRDNIRHNIKKIITINSNFSAFKTSRMTSKIPLTYISGADFIERYNKVTAPHTTTIELENSLGLSLGKNWYRVVDKYLDLP